MPVRQLLSIAIILLAGLATTSAVAAFLEARATSAVPYVHWHGSPQPARVAGR
jgi:hypothetical protein